MGLETYLHREDSTSTGTTSDLTSSDKLSALPTTGSPLINSISHPNRILRSPILGAARSFRRSRSLEPSNSKNSSPTRLSRHDLEQLKNANFQVPGYDKRDSRYTNTSGGDDVETPKRVSFHSDRDRTSVPTGQSLNQGEGISSASEPQGTADASL
jgi:hypothetical protein